MYKTWKYFEKGQSHAREYLKHETARTCSDSMLPKDVIYIYITQYYFN